MSKQLKFFILFAIMTLLIHLNFEVQGLDNFYVTALSILLIKSTFKEEE